MQEEIISEEENDAIGDAVLSPGLRSCDELRRAEEILGDIDRIQELLKGKKSIHIFVDGDNNNGVMIHNDERDKVSYSNIRKAAEESVENLKEELAKLGFEYSEKS